MGSNNQKKLAELTRLLKPLGIALRTPDELGQPFDPIEDQPDFAGNARKKATLLANLSGGIALADDSGLCVDALDGRPGVLSARYGGPGLDDRDRLLRLLAELHDVPTAKRTARFVCSLCVAAPGDRVLTALEQACEGVLRTEPTGAEGFGYDPIFVPLEYANDPSQSFAVLGADIKDRLSHRGKALRQLTKQLPKLLA
ncbi:MAG TPA: non-canonical purine NTP pyrophosphatase [Planctomycetes bacterium]|nr:non-canonical purine NTP pyrophosphatase [Planctomycetota bacterium]